MDRPPYKRHMPEDHVTLRDYFERVMSERDRALSAALAAQEKATAAAFLASEKAIELAEASAAGWRAAANEWRQAMTDRESRFAPRENVEALEKQVDALQISQSTGDGGARANSANRNQIQWVIGLIVSIVMATAGYLIAKP